MLHAEQLYSYPFKVQNSSHVFKTEQLISDINRFLTEQTKSKINKFLTFRFWIDFLIIMTEKT